MRTLSSLGILPLLSSPPTLSWDTATPKPEPNIFRTACASAGVPISDQNGQGVIMVGDELEAYVTTRSYSLISISVHVKA